MMKMGTGSQVFLAATASAIALSANPAMAQADGHEIIVTGSRIAKSEFTSADPIQVNDPEKAKMHGQVHIHAILTQVQAEPGLIQLNSTNPYSVLPPGYKITTNG